jgi:N utilization substance protein A
MTNSPEEILAGQAADAGSAEEISEFSTEDIAAVEDELSSSDANDANDAREADIELENDTVDELVEQAQEVSDDGIDNSGHDRG